MLPVAKYVQMRISNKHDVICVTCSILCTSLVNLSLVGLQNHRYPILVQSDSGIEDTSI